MEPSFPCRSFLGNPWFKSQQLNILRSKLSKLRNVVQISPLLKKTKSQQVVIMDSLMHRK